MMIPDGYADVLDRLLKMNGDRSIAFRDLHS